MFSGDLYFDVLIIELFKIYQFIGRTPGEGTHEKVFVGVSRWGGVKLNSLRRRFVHRVLGVGRNYF